MSPDVSSLLTLTRRLEEYQVPYALGGSGLLHSLGLTDSVRDWDILTEASKTDVLHALSSLSVKESASGDFPFASRYKLLIHAEGTQVEVIGHFAIYSETGLCRIPAVPTGSWQGLQTGSAEVWYAAYALMNRTDKANLLLTYLKKNGADPHILQRLLQEPLPDHIACELAALLAD